MNPVLTLEENKLGKDYVCGDIHGNFHLLKQALIKLNFNPYKDRIICTGDLVDKGKNSYAAKDWLEKDYFFSAFGNHDIPFAFLNDIELFESDMYCMNKNGSIDPWFVNLGEENLSQMGVLMRKKMFPAIEVETSTGLVGIIHAELPRNHTWSQIKESLNNKDYSLLRDCCWNREFASLAVKRRIEHNHCDSNVERCLVPDLSHVFHGHSFSESLNYEPYSIANRYYIDTCSYKEKPNAGLSLFDIRNPELVLYKASLANQL